MELYIFASNTRALSSLTIILSYPHHGPNLSDLNGVATLPLSSFLSTTLLSMVLAPLHPSKSHVFTAGT